MRALAEDFFKTPRILLAPMEGVIDASMRKVLTSIGGIDLVTTEFIRDIGQEIPAHVFLRYCPELTNQSKTESGVPVLVQLLGSDPESLARNAVAAVKLGAYGVDLNFGCPAKTVNRHDGGATLLKDPSRIEKILKIVRAAVPKPTTVSAKVRIGFSDATLALEITEAVCQGGADFLTIHGRTKAEMYQPLCHWDVIQAMNQKVAARIPVIANGECWNTEHITAIKSETGCQHVMLGRGLIADPFLALRVLKPAESPSAQIRANLVGEIIADCLAADVKYPTRFAAARTKQWLRAMSTNSEWAKSVFEKIKTLESLDLEQWWAINSDLQGDSNATTSSSRSRQSHNVHQNSLSLL